MRTFFLSGLLLLLGVVLLSRCAAEPDPEALFTQHCGSCHQPPAPASLPKGVWQQSVLPEMGARMGIPAFGYDPARNTSAEEFALIRDHGFYPDTPTLPYDDWTLIQQYILDLAPDSLPAPPRFALEPLRGFTPHAVDTDGKGGSLVTYIGQGTEGLFVGDGYGKVTSVTPDGVRTPVAEGRAPITHFTEGTAGRLVLEIGNIYPTEASNGTLYTLLSGTKTVVAEQLHRPVYFLTDDLDGDGREEVVVCEYGNYTGALTLLRPDGAGGYERSRLSGTAGTVRVVARDLNGDERKDLIVLHAQGDEGIDILYQQSDGAFRRGKRAAILSRLGQQLVRPRGLRRRRRP